MFVVAYGVDTNLHPNPVQLYSKLSVIPTARFLGLFFSLNVWLVGTQFYGLARYFISQGVPGYLCTEGW